jgi:hypothetical protein
MTNAPGLGERIWQALLVVGITVSGVAVLLGAVAWGDGIGVFSTSKFEQQKWLQKPPLNLDEPTCYRGAMAKDIKNRVLQPGMTRQDVETLLGEPDKKSRPREYQYTLGMCSGPNFKMAYDALYVYFGDDWRLTYASISQQR